MVKVDKAGINQLIKAGSPNITRTICETIFNEAKKLKDFSKVLDPALKLWQIGLTKVFMKETIKGVLETSMGLAIYNEVKNIQRLFRGFRDRKFVKKLRSSTKFIKQ